MKKMLSVLIIAMLPSYAFALIGFGLQFGSDLSKLGPQSYTEVSEDLVFNVNSYEMESNPVGGGGYAFVDLFGFALEGEFDVAYGEYEFSFGNRNLDFDIPFGWTRASYAATLKKNIMDLSIPFLAKAAVNAGGGFGGHVSTPRANVEMVRELFGDDLINLSVDSEDLEDNLVSYLKDNAIEASGLHLQAGLRFKVLVLDTHLNARYNLAKNVYDGKNGFLQLMFKMGFAF